MPKPWYSIKAAAADADVAEVSILDAINDWYGVNARSFLSEFRALKQNKVRVYINSPGGSVVEALAIFNGMRATGKEIEVHVLGIAASAASYIAMELAARAASYIAMAGDKVVMPANTMMFLHNPINGVYGNADELRSAADTLDKFAEVLTATYMKRWKGEEQALKDVLAAETFLTAAECLEHGLCDEVVDEISATAAFDVDQMPENVRALFARGAPSGAPAPTAPAPVAMAEIERVAAAAGVAEHAGSLALDPKLTTLAAFEAAAAEAADIVSMCRMTSRLDAAAGYVRARKSLADVRAEILAAQVADDEARVVDTAPPAATNTPQAKAGDINPIRLWDQIRAMQAGSKK